MNLKELIQTQLVYCRVFGLYLESNSICRFYRLRNLQENLDFNSSLNETNSNSNPSKSSATLLSFLILSLGICVTCYCCKRKSANKTMETDNRLSEDSQTSQGTIEGEDVLIE